MLGAAFRAGRVLRCGQASRAGKRCVGAPHCGQASRATLFTAANRPVTTRDASFAVRSSPYSGMVKSCGSSPDPSMRPDVPASHAIAVPTKAPIAMTPAHARRWELDDSNPVAAATSATAINVRNAARRIFWTRGEGPRFRRAATLPRRWIESGMVVVEELCACLASQQSCKGII